MTLTLRIYPFEQTVPKAQESLERTWCIPDDIEKDPCPFFTRFWVDDAYHYISNIPESNNEFTGFPVPGEPDTTLLLKVTQIYRGTNEITIIVHGFSIYQNGKCLLIGPRELISKFKESKFWKCSPAFGKID